MRPLLLAVLAVAALAACGEKTPSPPTPEEAGKELATFKSLFVPVSSGTWASMKAAQERSPNSLIQPNHFPDPYARGVVVVGGRDTIASVAYASVMLAPAGTPLEAMSVTQYLRVFEYDTQAELARVIAPKGNIFIAKDALPSVAAAARDAGASTNDAPYSLVSGTGR